MATVRLSSSIAAVIAALLIGAEVPAAAHQIAHKISGSSIKPNTITGKQVKESTLATVPSATLAHKLPPLSWHALTDFDNEWKSAAGDLGSTARAPAYAVDAQGLVHLRGVIEGGVANAQAIELPASIATPTGVGVELSGVVDNGNLTEVFIEGRALTPFATGTSTVQEVSGHTSLEGITYSIR